MKTTIKNFAFAAALIAASFTANAEDKETKKAASFATGIYPTKDGKVNVLIDKASDDANTVLLLKDESGSVVYRETVGKSNQKFGRILNVNDLQAGKYQLEIISGKEVQSKTFILSEQKVERSVTIN